MTLFIKQLVDDMRKCGKEISDKDYNDLLSFGSCDTEEELIKRIVMVSYQYIAMAEQANYYKEIYKKRVHSLESEKRELSRKLNISYAENMKQRKEEGVYPADKNISYEVVKKLADAGYTQQEVADLLGISRSTVCRRLREAKEKGFTNEATLKFNL